MHLRTILTSRNRQNIVLVRLKGIWKHKKNKSIEINFLCNTYYQKVTKKSIIFTYQRVFAKLIPFTARIFP